MRWTLLQTNQRLAGKERLSRETLCGFCFSGTEVIWWPGGLGLLSPAWPQCQFWIYLQKGSPFVPAVPDTGDSQMMPGSCTSALLHPNLTLHLKCDTASLRNIHHTIVKTCIPILRPSNQHWHPNG